MFDNHRQNGTVDLLLQKQRDNALQFGTGLCILRNKELEFGRYTLPTYTTTQFCPGTVLPNKKHLAESTKYHSISRKLLKLVYVFYLRYS